MVSLNIRNQQEFMGLLEKQVLFAESLQLSLHFIKSLLELVHSVVTLNTFCMVGLFVVIQDNVNQGSQISQCSLRNHNFGLRYWNCTWHSGDGDLRDIVANFFTKVDRHSPGISFWPDQLINMSMQCGHWNNNNSCLALSAEWLILCSHQCCYQVGQPVCFSSGTF